MFDRNETHNSKGKQAFRDCWYRMPRTREASGFDSPNARRLPEWPLLPLVPAVMDTAETTLFPEE
jgi:hypothetical protein